MNYSDKGLVTAIQEPFLLLANVVVDFLNTVWQLILLPFKMTADLFDNTKP